MHTHDVAPNVYSGDEPNGTLSFIAHLILLRDQGYISGTVGDDPESQQFAAGVLEANRGWAPGQVPVVPNRFPISSVMTQLPIGSSRPTTRSREAGSRRTVRRATARGPDDPEPGPPALAGFKEQR